MFIFNIIQAGDEMINKNRYKEIQITYIHIITLIIAFVAIGLFLFFLGYKIGKSSLKNTDINEQQNDISRKIIKLDNQTEYSNKNDNLNDNANETKSIINKNSIIKQSQKSSEIDKELQMHNTVDFQTKSSIKEKKVIKTPVKKIKADKITRRTYYAIQIGAFRDYNGAKKEAQKFSKKYSFEISKSGNLFKVRIGSFKTKKRAESEIKKNSKLRGCYAVKIKR